MIKKMKKVEKFCVFLYFKQMIHNIKGTVVDTPEKYEFVSDKKTKGGLPYLHIHVGKKRETMYAKARGLVAIGGNANALLSIGFISLGLISFGLFSVGLLAFGALAIGLISYGVIAMGGTAFGVIAIGLMAAGVIAIGYLSFGAVSIGYVALTSIKGIGIGKKVFAFFWLPFR
jgi:hypothetical protein